MYTIDSKNEGIITVSDDMIIKGDLCYDIFEDVIGECLRTHPESYYNKYCKKIIVCKLDANGECLNCDNTLTDCKCYKP
jgi:hypothetical protein